MPIRVALRHTTHYRYDRLVTLSPQIVRLRPAPHGRTPIVSYSFSVLPKKHFLNWQQDPHGNFLARMVFPDQAREMKYDVELIAEMTVINPFDFFLEPYAEEYPFQYAAIEEEDLEPYLRKDPAGPFFSQFLSEFDRKRRRTVDSLVEFNQKIREKVGYIIRMEAGVQSCEETLEKRSGSCRDSAWLLVQIMRHLGFASRFVSGYLIQLAPDEKPLSGPPGPEKDFTDLHAWVEVYLPGAGWVGLDPTSGLFAGEGHIPLAATPAPASAAAVTGATSPCQTEFSFSMSVQRVREDPRVTKPYSEEEWKIIDALGAKVDGDLEKHDVRLTMGGEPTFVALGSGEAPEWNVDALGDEKRDIAGKLLRKLHDRFAPGGALHFGEGKWYPGEPLPRWALGCFWRSDGGPVWSDMRFVDDGEEGTGADEKSAERFMRALAKNLRLEAAGVMPAYEDVYHLLNTENKLPINLDPSDSKLSDPQARRRISRIFEEGLGKVVGYVMPLAPLKNKDQIRWRSASWKFRAEHCFLLPGDSPMGLRLPLDSMEWVSPEELTPTIERDPFDARPALPDKSLPDKSVCDKSVDDKSVLEMADADKSDDAETNDDDSDTPKKQKKPKKPFITALCVQARDGRLHVFLPPLGELEDYLDLVAAIEVTAIALAQPVLMEGYEPPHDPRLERFTITPDPGVLEVNIHPSSSWKDLVAKTLALYEDARASGLGTDKFALDGKHNGTGGGNHVIIGGASPADSPVLRRPDLLQSLVSFWNNHPSLSYLFSGLFIGPTSQAPRVDEARDDALYELEIAFRQVPVGDEPCPPWLVDRIFRNLLVDVTGNTHRAEFCIDKLYPPDTAGRRLGLIELRAFEMPPHARMSLAQQLLLRALIARFWKAPYRHDLVAWGTSLHDRFMLPWFVAADFREVIEDLRDHGYPFRPEWFASHIEFRFPLIGTRVVDGVELEFRQALEPWHVLGEEPAGGAQTRYVDSSIERLQIKASGMIPGRHAIACNRRRVPLNATGAAGECVAGVRYRAWQPPNCLHPTIPVDAPLVFDLVDVRAGKSLGGATYHVSHPGGLSFDTFPVNAVAAESRRASLFFRQGHTPGNIELLADEPNASFPLTLDLRRK